jgi:hypothetical protein
MWGDVRWGVREIAGLMFKVITHAIVIMPPNVVQQIDHRMQVGKCECE